MLDIKYIKENPEEVIARLQKKGKHCLIIVGYDILQFNWLNEIIKHTNESGHLIGGQVVKKGLNKGKLRKGNMEERITDLISNYYLLIHLIPKLLS